MSLRHKLRVSDLLAASDSGIPPAPPDTAGHVGAVLRGGCPGSGMREVGIPCACRGTSAKPWHGAAVSARAPGSAGGGMGRVVMAPWGSWSHGAVDTCLAPLLSKCPPSLAAQFLAVCRRSKWSKHVTNAPCRALLAMDGSKAACKI